MLKIPKFPLSIFGKYSCAVFRPTVENSLPVQLWHMQKQGNKRISSISSQSKILTDFPAHGCMCCMHGCMCWIASRKKNGGNIRINIIFIIENCLLLASISLPPLPQNIKGQGKGKFSQPFKPKSLILWVLENLAPKVWADSCQDMQNPQYWQPDAPLLVFTYPFLHSFS